jgi:hypothetical protein
MISEFTFSDLGNIEIRGTGSADGENRKSILKFDKNHRVYRCGRQRWKNNIKVIVTVTA